MVLRFVLLLVVISVFSEAHSSACKSYFSFRNFREAEVLDVEEITIEEGGTFRQHRQVDAKEFLDQVPKTALVRIFEYQGVRRVVEVVNGNISITNKNTGRIYKLHIEDANINGTFSEDHRFWIMPHNQDRFLVWAFSREKNNLAEIFFDEMSEVRSFKYLNSSSVPFIEVTFTQGDLNGKLHTKIIYINLYTMKTISRDEFIKNYR